MDTVLHDDIFEVIKVNPEGRKFDRVNRLACKGQTYETDLTLDIASEVYSLKEGEKFTLSITNTLRLDGKPDEDTYNQDGKVSTGLGGARREEGCALAHTKSLPAAGHLRRAVLTLLCAAPVCPPPPTHLFSLCSPPCWTAMSMACAARSSALTTLRTTECPSLPPLEGC
jgi:hypothetical protein